MNKIIPSIIKPKDVIIIFVLLVIVPIFSGLVFGGAARVGSILLCLFTLGIPLCIIYLGLRSKALLLSLNLLISVSLMITTGLFQYFVNGFTQMISFFLLLLFIALAVANFINIFVRWGESGVKTLMPIGITLATVLLVGASGAIGQRAKLHSFDKQLPEFEDAVKMIEGKIVGERIILSGEDIPQEYRHLAKYISGDIDENGTLIVTFVWGFGFPVKHTAYAYISDGELPERDSEFRKDWYHCTRINEKWFKVGD